MALVKGTKTAPIGVACNTFVNPNWIGSMLHDQNTGSDSLLVVLIAYQNGTFLRSVTYNGVSMTKAGASPYTGSASVSVDVYYLASPSTGSNSIVITASSQITVGCLAQSFTGAQSSITNIQFTALANTPNSASITISANSMIMAWSQSTWSYDTAAAITINGTAVPFSSCDINGQVYSGQFCAHTCDANLTSGSKTIITDTQDNGWQATNGRLEILESASTVTRRIFVTG